MKEISEEKKYRFYYHYYKQYNKMSIHFKGQCIVVKDVECQVPTKTKWFEIQPHLRLYGWCTDVIVQNEKVIIL